MWPSITEEINSVAIPVTKILANVCKTTVLSGTNIQLIHQEAMLDVRCRTLNRDLNEDYNFR